MITAKAYKKLTDSKAPLSKETIAAIFSVIIAAQNIVITDDTKKGQLLVEPVAQKDA